MESPAKVATPAELVSAVVVPESVPPIGLAPMAMVTEIPAVDTAAPPESRSRTVTEGVIEATDVTADGWVENASADAVVTVTIPLAAPTAVQDR